MYADSVTVCTLSSERINHWLNVGVGVGPRDRACACRDLVPKFRSGLVRR
jgi:hypothetical protein